MKLFYFKKLFVTLLLFTAALIFIGGDCSTETDTDVGVAVPTGINVVVDADSGETSYAVISWQHSPDRDRTDFDGYKVGTSILNENNQVVSYLTTDFASSNQSSVIVENIEPGTRYQSFIYSMLSGGQLSDSISTIVYSGIYYFNDGRIDEFTQAEPTMSGFGWNLETGEGSDYSFTQSNAPMIDLHMRGDSLDQIYFHSPDNFNLTDAKNTLILNIGTGEEAFDKSDLQEPTNDSTEVVADNVYLLKLQDDYYVKLWVKSIEEIIATPPYKTIVFEYKVQTAEGLRVL